jgi:hypothetical protein
MKYEVTDQAGPTVAGFQNPGVGETIELTERQAEHPLRLGHLKLLQEKVEPEAPAPEPELPFGTSRKTRRKSNGRG